MDDVRRKLEQLLRERGQLAKKQAQIDEQLRELEEMYHQGLAMIRANPGPAVPARVRRALREQSKARNVNTSVELAPAHKIAISKASKGKGPFFDAVRASGLTMRGLAEAVGCLPSLLSMYRRRDDPRPIPRDRAEAIEKLTGWPADAKHWPGGIA